MQSLVSDILLGVHTANEAGLFWFKEKSEKSTLQLLFTYLDVTGQQVN